MVFSPPLYLTVSVPPPVAVTMSPTVPLVMVLFGIVYGRCPSPVPRCDSAKMCTSSAFWLPSGCGMAVLPTNEPALMSARLALATPTIWALAVSVSVTSAPSIAFTTTVSPSTFSIAPRIRTVCGCCAETAVTPTAARKAAPAANRNVRLRMRCTPSHRRRRVAPDIDARHRQRAVRLLARRVDEDLRPGLELGLVTRRVCDNRAFRADGDLLLAVRGHLLDRRVGHGAVGLQVPRPMAFAGAAHGLREDVDLHAFLAAVGQ